MEKLYTYSNKDDALHGQYLVRADKVEKRIKENLYSVKKTLVVQNVFISAKSGQ